MRYAKEAGNRRIFRDLINEQYDPFELEKAGVKYSTKKILDPLKHDLEKVSIPSLSNDAHSQRT